MFLVLSVACLDQTGDIMRNSEKCDIDVPQLKQNFSQVACWDTRTSVSQKEFNNIYGEKNDTCLSSGDVLKHINKNINEKGDAKIDDIKHMAIWTNTIFVQYQLLHWGETNRENREIYPCRKISCCSLSLSSSTCQLISDTRYGHSVVLQRQHT